MGARSPTGKSATPAPTRTAIPTATIDSAAYWDLSYTYTRPDVLGFGYMSMNVAMRNIFNNNPDPIPSGVGHESYVDNIMGRIAFARLTIGF